MWRMQVAFLLVSLLSGIAAFSAEETQGAKSVAPEVAAEWEMLVGTWERTVKRPNGEEILFEKTVAVGRETLKLFASDGTLIREQCANLKIERCDNLRVLRWSNAVVTGGAGIGAEIEDGTCVYTFKEGRLISVVGLAEGEPWAVYAEAWDRRSE